MSVTSGEIKNIKSLLSHKGRQRLGCFSAEGVRLLEEALRHRFLPETVYFSESLLSERGLELAEGFRSRRVEVKAVTAQQMERMSDTRSPQGILGRFVLPDQSEAKLWTGSGRNILLCEDINDPGNLGTLIRSALAFGFDRLALCGNAAEVYAPKVLRASAGALFAIKTARTNVDTLRKRLADSDWRLVAADLRGEPIRRLTAGIKGTGKLILALGSEAEGLSSELLELASLRMRLEHDRKVESLNVAVAGSILMQQIYDAI